MSSDVYIHRKDIPEDCLYYVCKDREHDYYGYDYRFDGDQEPDGWDKGLRFQCGASVYKMIEDTSAPSFHINGWDSINGMTARRFSELLRRCLQKLDRIPYQQLRDQYGQYMLTGKQTIRDMQQYAWRHPHMRIHVES